MNWTDTKICQPACKEQIETPALLIDLDAMEANIAQMASYFHERPCKLRPHAKTHKTPLIAHKQLAAGSAVGITVAKLGEAEVMIKGGIQDVLLANQVVEPAKLARLAGLSRHATLTLAVDDLSNAAMLDQIAAAYGTIVGVLIEVNVGLNRCGVPWGEPALDLARQVLELNHLNFRGLMGYEGHVVLLRDPQDRVRLAHEAMEKLLSTRDLLVRNGIDVEIVSAGGTGTYNITGDLPGIDEVQAGSYVFMDDRYQQTSIGFAQSLYLYSTVISRPSSEMAILDAGLKSITSDWGSPVVKDRPDWKVEALHEEHALVRIPGGDRTLRPGDKIELVPSHGCTTINLHDWYYALRGNRIEAVWDIAARGCFR